MHRSEFRRRSPTLGFGLDANVAFIPVAIIASFEHYLKQEGTKASRAEFIGILDDHLNDRGFCSDMIPLLRTDITYDPQAAGKYVKTHLLNSTASETAR